MKLISVSPDFSLTTLEFLDFGGFSITGVMGSAYRQAKFTRGY